MLFPEGVTAGWLGGWQRAADFFPAPRTVAFPFAVIVEHGDRVLKGFQCSNRMPTDLLTFADQARRPTATLSSWSTTALAMAMILARSARVKVEEVFGLLEPLGSGLLFR
jgi:hypothetical protein